MGHSQDEPYYISVEIVNRRCKVLRKLEDLGIQQFKVIDIRASTGGSTRHLVKMAPKQIDKIRGGARRIRSGGKSRRETSAWFDSDGCDVCDAILSHGSFLISGRTIEDHALVYTFITPSFDAFRSIISTLEETGSKLKVLEVGKYKPKGKVMTEKQEKVLWLALRMGFFDYPRKVNSIELSRRLGIGPSTFSEITRRGIRRLLEHYWEIR